MLLFTFIKLKWLFSHCFSISKAPDILNFTISSKSKGKTNDILNKFINKNKNKVSKQTIGSVNYHNSNYQRKKRDEKDEEVIVWGNYE